jgi:RNA polymerase sigma-70 factor (ECF subfamily)
MQHNNIKAELAQYHNDCYCWALHCCYRDKDIASEVLQIAYLKILERGKSFRGESTFKTWVFIVIRNTATDALKKQKKWGTLYRSIDQLNESLKESSIGEDFENKLRTLFFSEGIGKLSERQQQILQLVFYHDLSLTESAAVLEISQGSARKHYDRAKKSLAAWFEKNGIEEFK